jgi:hypothetical protein
MNWSYRVVKTDSGFAVYEVYFDEAGKAVGIAEKPETRWAETLEGLKEELEVLLEALNSPPIAIEDIPGDK